MKHSLPVSILLVSLFLFSQLIGLVVINKDAAVSVSESGEINVTHGATALGERPDIKGGATTLYILTALVIGTTLLLILIRFRKFRIWKIWYFAAVWATITITVGVYLNPLVSAIIALVLALAKILKPGLVVHNITEIAMYSGIALLFVPLLNVAWIIVILLVISLYDAYAVWKSKHMIKMAKFTMKSKVFAGLAIPYKGRQITGKPGKAHTAILGGGDVAFPLMFSGVVMEQLISSGATKMVAYYQSIIIVAFATIAVAYLLVKGEKGKFYPAMPFITAGCLIGYGIILLL